MRLVRGNTATPGGRQGGCLRSGPAALVFVCLLTMPMGTTGLVVSEQGQKLNDFKQVWQTAPTDHQPPRIPAGAKWVFQTWSFSEVISYSQ